MCFGTESTEIVILADATEELDGVTSFSLSFVQHVKRLD
jgi:hypothetical protein